MTRLIEETGNDILDHPKAAKFANESVIRKVDACVKGQGWPGTHRSVNVWYVVSPGYFVGFNENPSRGWAFPVYTPTKEEFDAALEFKEFGWDC